MDLTYRTELRTLNDTNFARFEAFELRVDRQFADLRAALSQQLRWMIGLWMTSMVGLFAVLATLMRQGG